MVDAALRTKERESILDAHRENLADVLPLEQNAQGLRIESFATADVAEHLNIRQETHLDALPALTFASLAASARGVERKTAGGESAHARLSGVGIQSANRIPKSDIRCRARARSLADGRLIDLQHAADRLPSCDGIAADRCDLGFARALGPSRPRQQALQVVQEHVARER